MGSSTVSSLSTSLVYALQEAADALEEQLTPLVAKAGLTLPQFSLLFYVIEEGPMRLGELARKERCVKSNVSNLVRKMEAQDLVMLRSDEGDRRARLIAATREGRARYASARRAVQQTENTLRRALGEEASSTLARLSLAAAGVLDESR